VTDVVLHFFFSCASLCRCGAVDGCHTQLLTPFGAHKEDYTDKNSNFSLLMLGISDTRSVCYFVGGLPGSQGDSLAFCTRSWHASMFEENLSARPLSAREFILGDAGFALTAFLVRTDSVVGRIREQSGATGGHGRWPSCSGSCPLEMEGHSGWYLETVHWNVDAS